MRLIGLLVLAASTLVVGSDFALEAFRVDRCLDGGGSFDFDRGICDYAMNHPFSPYLKRHLGLLLSCTTGALAGLGLVLLVRVRPQVPSS